MNHMLLGAGLSAASRLLSGEVQIEGKARAALEGALCAIEDVYEVVDDLSAYHPSSWFGFARRLLKRSMNEPDIQWTEQWLELEGYVREEDRLPALWIDLCSRAPRTIAFREDREVVWRYQVGAGQFYIPLDVGTSIRRSGSSWRHPTVEVRLPSCPVEYARFRTAVADFFWLERDAVLIDHVTDHVEFIAAEVDGPRYIGPLTSQLDRWERYRTQGLRRCVLLQGAPGSGKSTFACEAARRLSGRTVFMTSAAVNDIGASDWQLLLELLMPEMVVVDDVDRVTDACLERNLRMFEESHCPVPFILFTSNDHTKLPRPMRRPGRIDQILRTDEPDRSVILDVIQTLAAREGVSVPAARIPTLIDIAETTSTAHVVELFRRARVEGWDAERLTCDITFGDGFAPKRKTRRCKGS